MAVMISPRIRPIAVTARDRREGRTLHILLSKNFFALGFISPQLLVSERVEQAFMPAIQVYTDPASAAEPSQVCLSITQIFSSNPVESCSNSVQSRTNSAQFRRHLSPKPLAFSKTVLILAYPLPSPRFIPIHPHSSPLIPIF